MSESPSIQGSGSDIPVPITDSYIGSMSASKLLGGRTGQFVKWGATTPSFSSLLSSDIITALGYTPANPTSANTWSALQTFSAGITISNSNINLGTNSINFSYFGNFVSGSSPDSQNSVIFSGSSPSNTSIITVQPVSGQNYAYIDFSNVNAYDTNATWLSVGSGAGLVTTNFGIVSLTKGTSAAIPIEIWMQASNGGSITKLMSFDIAKTITAYVRIIQYGTSDSYIQNTVTSSQNSDFVHLVNDALTYAIGISGTTGAFGNALYIYAGSLLWSLNNAGNMLLKGIISSYDNITTAGLGVPAIYFSNYLAAQTAGITLTSYTTPASDGTYEVGANLVITALGSGGSVTVTINWTDSTNTARTYSYPAVTSVSNEPFSTITIRTKASTTISITTSISVSATYNISGHGKQIA